ncbi:NaeI family type II restriction endonuclease [Nocardiopsis sp. RSe5-2]|uniref:NaeI family type II restriction endonuclease n=1 Tax=Nocardiopsis endophytica TaxID=3018445 RepID=A0ABT4U3C8_9ACTN|nr:NaeI family type II restriction endonuclease [Nocardiopsis endophytica]MDA2810979.1 NaeI family type II restriction endonuclease [Nocardiopsis endophytica]
MEEIFGRVFRQAIDEVLDGQRTGRFDLYASNVAKTERTYLGTKVEIICQDEFGLDRGEVMDYRICGHEVDAKFSMTSRFSQAIPTEAVGRICLFMYAQDQKGEFSVGLMRPTDDVLNPGSNKDGKRTIKKEGRSKIRWLVENGRLPENQLLRFPASVVEQVFSRRLSGQGRVTELFRRVQGSLIRRETLITVARQHDGPKRARDSRLRLADEGIVILCSLYGHPQIASELGLPVPGKSEWVSARLVERPVGDDRPFTVLSGIEYVVAQNDEPACRVPAKYGSMP